RIETGHLRAIELVDPGGRDEETGQSAGRAELPDPAQPVLAFLPIPSPALEHLLQVTGEIVGEDTDDHELGLESLSIFDEGVIILLGRVAEMTRVQDLDRGTEPFLEVALQAFRRSLVISHEQALHVAVAPRDA